MENSALLFCSALPPPLVAARASFSSTLASTYPRIPRFAPPDGRTIDLLRELLGWSDCLPALIVLREFNAHLLHIHINNLCFIRNQYSWKSFSTLVDTTIDDRDERIQYASGWSHLTGGSRFNNTVTLTRSAGASASSDFSGAEALGIGGNDGKTILTYTIDGEIGFSQFDRHSAWYWLDFLIVTSPIHTGSTGASTSSPNSNTATDGGISVGAIVGIAADAVALLGLIVVTLTFFQRRQKWYAGVPTKEEDSDKGGIRPFLIPQPGYSSNISNDAASNAAVTRELGPPSTVTTSRKSRETRQQHSPPFQATDAGIRLLSRFLKNCLQCIMYIR
ncbi:hypothetical protein M422DRAFT_263666 [Sphaerobolus stellatus SS14]|uniref:Uncharacterized protein n=1 Tax=Sphaerobolus stellatus (strain SS14) TaxID=990650 RepID=A0A0C9TVJ8_SPHS4|nr:hypothetical protein M422DRAFT_263666 [Sphaerobolus stellatus SS14]